ncbi:hypothetical protein [Caulobacter hibisci]|uniref:Uncharacterized protein n=1 Tax=Caulobacter hibisci TaxID=2035993 RepID=A0ABS0T008_9CAUL|nr:hypothetical protein [Caulobacter hibisci]MBI1685218.1 hypothetical protein [Caulobacter hibisci]
MTPFRWKNCFADVQASQHDLTIQSYFDDVISPALATLEARIAELGRSDDPGDRFAQSDMEDVLREAKLAFGLSIQSIWERQLRGYLSGCARDLRPDEPFAAKIEKAVWDKLCKIFRTLRGIRLEAFPAFAALDMLHHLGNACRHGDGDSAIKLANLCPDLWPTVPPLPPEFDPPPPSPPPVAAMDIPVERLAWLVAAIAQFWRDAEYIYNESIETKHPSLEAHLVRERAERHWTPQAHADDVA